MSAIRVDRRGGGSMPRTFTMTGDAFWSCRLAPYGLVVAVVAAGLSLIWVRPRFDYLALAAGSGAAVAICHEVDLTQHRTERCTE